MQRIEFRAMGCNMLAAIDADTPAAQAALAPVPAQFEVWEQALSRFRKDSELSALNARSGAPVPVSDTLWQVLSAALEAARWTDGLATPTVLKALEAAGYDRSFADLVAAPTSSPRPPVQVEDWRHVHLDPASRTVMLPPGVQLDLGGIAKGWAAEIVASGLAPAGPALVDAGGDIVVTGPQAAGEPWPIGVEPPYGDQRDLDLPLLTLTGGAVATSGRDYRTFAHGGGVQHHLIDPRTGRPADTDVLTATIIAPTALQAEAAAKVVLILGSSAGLAWIEAHPPLAALLIVERPRKPVVMSRRLAHSIWN